MGKFLIIGGSGVMGTAAIQAVRKVHGKNAFIIASWFGKEEPNYQIPGANCTIYGDITQDSCLDEIKSVKGDDFEFLFYATAMGEVGFPIKDSTAEQIAHSNRLSFDPLPNLETTFQVKTIVTYSTFYLLKHQVCSYGAMAHSKEKIEKWIVEKETKSQRVCIRAGLFESHSSRAIKLLLRKNARAINKESNPLLDSYFNGVPASQGIKKFESGICQEETDTYGDSGTTIDSLKEAHLTILKDNSIKFANVCGKKIWLSDLPLFLENNIRV
tara:strand:- start:2781 stop:3593 length:813 start_codon:yes stop_codon:yes gene_type:complete